IGPAMDRETWAGTARAHFSPGVSHLARHPARVRPITARTGRAPVPPPLRPRQRLAHRAPRARGAAPSPRDAAGGPAPARAGHARLPLAQPGGADPGAGDARRAALRDRGDPSLAIGTPRHACPGPRHGGARRFPEVALLHLEHVARRHADALL